MKESGEFLHELRNYYFKEHGFILVNLSLCTLNLNPAPCKMHAGLQIWWMHIRNVADHNFNILSRSADHHRHKNPD